jgi:dUTP pyrophosphatase
MDYRGEIGIILMNLSFSAIKIANKERIAQLVICPVFKPNIVEVSNLSNTERGDKGFGSTGTGDREQ